MWNILIRFKHMNLVNKTTKGIFRRILFQEKWK